MSLRDRFLIFIGISPCCYAGIFSWSLTNHFCKKCDRRLEDMR